jgi:hypothetical protein
MAHAFASQPDERLEGGGGVAPSGIVEAEPGERLRPVLKHANEASGLNVGTHVLFHEEAEPDAFQRSGPCEAGLVQGDRSGDIDLCRLAAFLELPPIKGAVRQANTDAVVVEEIRRDTRTIMLLEVRRRADDGKSLWTPKRNRDHVAGHEVSHPDTEIESLGDYVDQSSFGDEIDVNLRIAAEELQYQRREDLARRRCKRVNA